jgi:nitrate reductase (cytochrome), electron transfer subunit
MSDEAPGHETAPRGGRALHVFFAIVIALAVVGYLKGLREPIEPHEPRPTAGLGTGAPTAPTYAEMSTWRPADPVPSLQRRAEVPPEPPPPASAALRQEVRAERALNRAYDGSPPTVPHPVDEGPLDCMVCHEEGLRMTNLRAPQISHDPYTSCTQCHVPQALERPWADTPSLTGNRFAGLAEAAARGDVEPAPWPTAPPSIPHPTLMRTECLSCHGPTGTDALRTPHPERISCGQCHVGSALLDQRVTARPPFTPAGVPVQ